MRGAAGAAGIAPAGESKALRSLRARHRIRERYAAWAASARRTDRPLLWMHAPSVGEGLQARPVLVALRSARPDVQLAYTWFSPSAEAFASGLDVDFRDYLPFDTASDARAALAALRPRALVFSKLDVWPTLAREASRRGVRLGLVSATLATTSGRRRPLAAALLRPAYAALDAVGAIAGEDADRLIELGVRRSAIVVTGDTRYDQVWSRARAADLRSPLLSPLAPDAGTAASPRARLTVVAGSTWPADEMPLLAAWTEMVSSAEHGARPLNRPRLIIAPHEPTPAHLQPIERWAAGAGLSLARLGSTAAPSADVVLVDRLGVLGDLYALADIAFVGGAFHAAGLHSVLEPAAFGAPVLFGPRFGASRDAALLIEAGGGASVERTLQLRERLEAWLGNDAARHAAGARAREVVRGGLGAAGRSLALVEGLLDAR